MRLRWGLSERSPGGPRYGAPYVITVLIKCLLGAACRLLGMQRAPVRADECQ